MKMNRKMTLSVAGFAALLLAALLSVTVLGRHYSNPETYAGNIKALNEKKADIEKLAGAAAAASAAITLMPGDFGTPIADKLADLSGYFLLIMCTVYIEKILVTLGGILAFDILIPLGLILLAINIFWPSHLQKMALRVISLGIILVLLVPVSLRISGAVESQYEAEIQETIHAASQNSEEIQGTAERADDEGLWSQFVEKVKGGGSAVLERLESTLSSFTDAVAIYIVTTCVIPVVVLLLGLWLITLLFHIEIRLPRRMHPIQ